jgi:nitroreductase
MNFQESFSEAWQKRYGTEPTDEVPDLTPFLRHRSVRRYSDRAIEPALQSALFAVAQSAATSSNLQLWSAISVTDPEKREAIAVMVGNQNQVRRAPLFLAFFADLNRLVQASRAHDEAAEAAEFTEFYTMAVVDATLAAERLVVAAESIGLGTCYVGSLRNDPRGLKAVLGLPDRTFGVFGLCIGWPQPEAKEDIKPRLAATSVFFENTYADADIAEYNARMAEFYAAQNMPGDDIWSLKSAKRSRPSALGGRDGQLEFLRSVGLLLR